MNEEQWVAEDTESTVEMAERDGVDACVSYLLGLADDQGIETSAWTFARLRAAVADAVARAEVSEVGDG